MTPANTEMYDAHIFMLEKYIHAYRDKSCFYRKARHKALGLNSEPHKPDVVAPAIPTGRKRQDPGHPHVKLRPAWETGEPILNENKMLLTSGGG